MIAAAPVWAVAEIRAESEKVLEPTGRRGKSTSRKFKISQKSLHHSDSSVFDNYSSERECTNPEESEECGASEENPTDEDNYKSHRRDKKSRALTSLRLREGSAKSELKVLPSTNWLYGIILE